MSRNNVRGPTSALTEFLREAGITATTIARRRATADAANGLINADAGPSNADRSMDVEGEEKGDEEEEEKNASPRKRGRRVSHLVYS